MNTRHEERRTTRTGLERNRLARALHALLPDDSEVTGLLALMLLIDARWDQAAVNAVHDEAKTADNTDWPQLLALYGVLRGMSENPDRGPPPTARGPRAPAGDGGRPHRGGPRSTGSPPAAPRACPSSAT